MTIDSQQTRCWAAAYKTDGDACYCSCWEFWMHSVCDSLGHSLNSINKQNKPTSASRKRPRDACRLKTKLKNSEHQLCISFKFPEVKQWRFSVSSNPSFETQTISFTGADFAITGEWMSFPMAPMTHSVLSRNWSKVQVCRINLIQSYKLPPSINNQGQTDRVAILAEPNPWPWTILASYSHDLYRCKKSRSKVTWFKRYSGNRQIDEHNQVQYQGWIQGFASVGHPLFLPFTLAVWSPGSAISSPRKVWAENEFGAL